MYLIALVLFGKDLFQPLRLLFSNLLIHRHGIVTYKELLATTVFARGSFSLSRSEEFRASLVGIADTSRVESRDSNGCYFVVFDARYGELEYLPFQTEGYNMPGPQELDGFHPHTPRHLHPDGLRP